jgi:two-component system, OmpR family, response regulator RegX3
MILGKSAPPSREALEILTGGPVELDIQRHEARVRGTPVFLRVKEFDLLEAMLRRKHRVLSREFLIAAGWGFGAIPSTNTLDVHVLRLRRKVELEPGRPQHILTRRGQGYCFVEDPARTTG